MMEEAHDNRGIIDCTGETPVVRKVMGAMPVTEDGVVVGVKSRVFNLHPYGQIIEGWAFFSPQWMRVPCYSTREAAAAAAEAARKDTQ